MTQLSYKKPFLGHLNGLFKPGCFYKLVFKIDVLGKNNISSKLLFK